MNIENLHELIDRYTANYEMINNDDHFELFKWRAAKQFQKILLDASWENTPFSARFKEARNVFSVLTDNGFVSPATGIVKIAEQKEAEVESLFRDTLWADDTGNLTIRQNNMDKFIEGMDKLRLETFPGSYKYKQEWHAASCYLSLLRPEENYIYRHSDAETFAQYIEFGKDIGSGSSFRLDHYYEMCDQIVDALKQHQDLLDKYYARLDADDSFYYDTSLHLMAFDLMYCCRTYNFYPGLTFRSKKDVLKDYLAALEHARQEKELKKQIDALEDEIRSLNNQIEPYTHISLLDVLVQHKTLGQGRVISQSANKISVAFESCEKSYTIHRKFSFRPTFEDDEQTVAAFTEYSDLLEKLKKANDSLKSLLKMK